MLNILGENRQTATVEPDDAGLPRIRPCLPGDLAAVAALFKKTFGHRSRPGAPRLPDYLGEVFLDHPWRDPSVPSLVFVGPTGGVAGFIGVLPLRMELADEPVSAAIAGSLMVDNPAENPLAGARLMRTFLNGPQDLSLSETANAVSRRMWERLGGKAEPFYSMEFLRIFEPAGFALAVAAEKRPGLAMLKPLGRGIDAVAARFKANPLRLAPAAAGPLHAVEAGGAELAEAILDLSQGYLLRPAWDAETLPWFLGHAAEKDRYGALHGRVLLDRKDRPAGASLVYLRRRGVAYVLQMLARPEAREAVADDLFAHAFAAGAVAVRGRAQPDFADPLLHRRAVFLHASSTMIRAKRPDLLAPIEAGAALITGLAGEVWSRLIGGAFAA